MGKRKHKIRATEIPVSFLQARLAHLDFSISFYCADFLDTVHSLPRDKDGHPQKTDKEEDRPVNQSVSDVVIERRH